MDNLESENSYKEIELPDMVVKNPILSNRIGKFEFSILKIATFKNKENENTFLINGELSCINSQIEYLKLKFGNSKLINVEHFYLKNEIENKYNFSILVPTNNITDQKIIYIYGRIKTTQGYHSLCLGEIENIHFSTKSYNNLFEDVEKILLSSTKTSEIVDEVSCTIPKVAIKKLKHDYQNESKINLDLLEIHNFSLINIIENDNPSEQLGTYTKINNLFSLIRENNVVPCTNRKKTLKITNKQNKISSTEKPSIAIVTSELEYITNRSPWSIYVFQLANKLRMSYDVNILLLTEKDNLNKLQENINYNYNLFNSLQLKIKILPLFSDFDLLYCSNSIKTSYYVYHYLKENIFDNIIFQGKGGIGYYTILAKALQDGFENSNINLIMDQAIHLDNSLLSENVPVDEELEITFMERESINISNLVTTYNKDIYNCLNINPHILTKTILLEPYLSESHINYKKNSPNQTKIESLLITSKEINSVNIYFNKKNINLEILVSNSKCLDYLDQIIERIINFNGEIILDTSFKDIDYLIYYLKTNKTEFKLIKFHSNSYDILNYKDDDDSLRIDYLNSIKQADSITKNNFEINQIEHPLVSICIPTRNRSKQLIEALFSVEKSTYSNVEIIIVDDGSDNINHRNILNSIPIKFTKYPISIIEQTRNYPGYARNTAAGYSKGKYLFFLDDDNKLFSDTIESLVQSAEINDLHFITSTLEYADTSLLKKSLKPFLGNDISSSILKNNLGDTFSLIRRSSFVKLGGFDTTQNASYEDWELFSKAVLNNYPITTFPRALGIYNNTSNSYNKSSNKFNSKNQVINSYEQYINNEIKNSISYLIKSFETVVSTSLIIEDKVNNFSKTKFESSEEILLLLKDKDLFTYLLALENTEKLTSNKGLIISSPKGDPQVLIPKFKLEHTGGLYILIKVLSEKNDLSQLFYLTDEISQYNEKNQISLPIIEGENNLYFEIEDISKLTLPLRFDPGFSSSKFIIEHIEIRVKD